MTEFEFPKPKMTNDGQFDTFLETGTTWISLTLPLQTYSEANGGKKKTFKRHGKTIYKSENVFQANSRHQRQKAWVIIMLKPKREMFRLPCVVTITRFAPRKLDKRDNLPMSMKWIVDALCAVIMDDYRPGRADDTDDIDIRYRQESSQEYGVHILIELPFLQN